MSMEVDFNKKPISFAALLTCYSQDFNSADSKRWALEWLKAYCPSEYYRLQDVDEKEFSNRGFVCRMLSRGYSVPDKSIGDLVPFFKGINTKPLNPVEPKPQTKVNNPVNMAILQLDQAVDDILSNKTPSIVTLEVNSSLDETKEWLEKEIVSTSEQLAKFKDILTLLESTYTRIGGIVASLEKVKPKTVRPESVVQKKVAGQAAKTIDCLRSYPSLGLTGLSPAKIVGASRVFVYNTKYNQGMIFYAEPGKTLTISGSSVRNFDKERSFCKTVKKTAEFFKNKDLYVSLEEQKGTRYAITSHISNVMVIADTST